MLFLRVFVLQLRRALHTPTFWSAAVLFMIALLLNSAGPLKENVREFTSIIYLLGYSNLQIAVVALGVMPILPFSLSFLQEKREKSIRFQAIRCGLPTYIVTKYLAVLLSGFCVVVAGYLFFILTLSFFFPMYIGNESGAGLSLDIWLSMKRPEMYVIGFIYHKGLSGMMFAGLGFFASTFLEDKFSAIMMPYLAYLIAALSSALFRFSYRYDITLWLIELPFASTPIVSLLLKTLAVGLLLIGLGFASKRLIERGMLNE